MSASVTGAGENRGVNNRSESKNVVFLTGLRRGGLKRERVWVERACPERQWVIADVQEREDGQRRVLIQPIEDRWSEADYSESYFRRHFIDRTDWLRRRNETVLHQARKKNASELLHEMARINARATGLRS
jgi:hypothetical protein